MFDIFTMDWWIKLSIVLLYITITVFLVYIMFKGESLVTKNNIFYITDEAIHKKKKGDRFGKK